MEERENDRVARGTVTYQKSVQYLTYKTTKAALVRIQFLVHVHWLGFCVSPNFVFKVLFYDARDAGSQSDSVDRISTTG